MKTRTPARKRRATPRAIMTTLGDLISAAYEAVPGAGHGRVQLAMAVLSSPALARQLHPHVIFTR